MTSCQDFGFIGGGSVEKLLCQTFVFACFLSRLKADTDERRGQLTVSGKLWAQSDVWAPSANAGSSRRVAKSLVSVLPAQRTAWRCAPPTVHSHKKKSQWEYRSFNHITLTESMSFNETFHLHLKMLRLHGLKLNVVFVLLWQPVTFLHSSFNYRPLLLR